MSFTIVKIYLNSDNCIFKTTHGNNLQFLISVAFTFVLLDSNSADLRIMRTAVQTSFVHTVSQARLEMVTCFEMQCHFCTRYETAT